MAAVQHQPRAHYPRPSPFASSRYGALSTTASTTRYVNVSDSDSDDEPPPAIKFSKVTEALLNDRPIPSSPIRLETAAHRALRGASTIHANLETPSRAPGIRVIRKSSPSALDSTEKRRGSTPPRIVHIGSAQLGSARRTVSIAGPYPQHGMTPQAVSKLEIVTPGQASVQRARAGSNASQDGRPEKGSISRDGRIDPMDSAVGKPLDSRYATSTIGRTRNLTTEGGLTALSQRIKRAQIPTNSLLRGPVRRWRPRESDDNISPVEDYNSVAASAPSSSYTPQNSARSRSNSVNTRATSVEPDPVPEKHDHSSRPGSRQAQPSFSQPQGEARPPSRQTSQDQMHARLLSVEPQVQSSEQRLPHRNPGVSHSYRYVSAADEQENIPPPTFKRNKEQESKYLGRISAAVTSDDEKPRRPAAPLAERKPLGMISSNTPLRPAPPPPPKMSVLETATVTAGAATTKSRKKRTHVVINGKIFTQMGKIGKGGSSDVYCVMAENYKTFAMKKVKLEDCDETAVRGYKGEIDLLRKLTEVDRVVRLYDWELNEEKQELIVLMERGDTDLNRVLAMKLNGEGSKFDATFSRYHWKEMLECVQAVHEHDIVHSDLKPANFLVVQGRLKLIDFGIANAIDTDNTCNVHRDSHVGTPNYMSPESITDTNASGPGFQSNKDAEGRPLKKDMKIGKSSDVWSLGCILYQMTYGRPPFAHISNQISRIMTITNPKHVIEFPDTGIGGARIPASLKGVLRRCLQRDADLRPTITQLLSDSDDFLNPESNGAVMIRQEVLEQIINKVVDRCRDAKRGLPQAGEVAQYAPSFMAKIREMTEKV